MFVKNFQLLQDKCVADMRRWASLPLSVAGRVNLVKMVLLPKFLYLFQHIPIFINKSFFANQDKSINTFLWNNKPARIKRSILQLPKAEGGLALPNFRHYYWACNITKLIYWVKHGSLQDCPPWVHSEILSSKTSLLSIICSQLPAATIKNTSNPVVSDTIRIWLQFHKHFGLHRASTCAPILFNHQFPPSCSDAAFRIWSTNGLSTLGDLYIDGVFPSFSSLSAKYGLPNNHLFHFYNFP